MRKLIYIIVPIAGVIIFVFFYLAVKSDIKIREEARRVQAIKDQEERALQERKNRQEAYEMQRLENLRKIAEHEAREAEKARQIEEKQALEDLRDLAYRERERQFRRLTDLMESRGIAQEQLEHVMEHLKLQRVEENSLKLTTAEIMQNRRAYEQAVDLMENADKAHILRKQELDRAAAAKKNN